MDLLITPQFTINQFDDTPAFVTSCDRSAK